MRIIHHSFRRSFEIVKGSMPIAKVNFLRWYGMNAEARTPAGLFKFLVQNFWKSSFRIERNGEEIGDIKFTWKSSAMLNIQWSGEDDIRSYQFRRRGFLKSHYELTDESDQTVAILRTKINWRQFSSEAQIEYQQPIPENQQLELLMCCGYIITVLRSRRSSSG